MLRMDELYVSGHEWMGGLYSLALGIVPALCRRDLAVNELSGTQTGCAKLAQKAYFRGATIAQLFNDDQ